jgi:hypothetical protein
MTSRTDLCGCPELPISALSRAASLDETLPMPLIASPSENQRGRRPASSLRHKPASRSDIVSLRGRILTEWRHYREAYKDLTAAFADPDKPPAESVATLGALLLNKWIRGEMSRSTAFSEFDKLEQSSPENVWTAYYRAVCNVYLGNEEVGFRGSEERALHVKPAIFLEVIEALKQDPHDQRFQKTLHTIGRLAVNEKR